MQCLRWTLAAVAIALQYWRNNANSPTANSCSGRCLAYALSIPVRFVFVEPVGHGLSLLWLMPHLEAFAACSLTCCLDDHCRAVVANQPPQFPPWSTCYTSVFGYTLLLDGSTTRQRGMDAFYSRFDFTWTTLKELGTSCLCRVSNQNSFHSCRLSELVG